MFLFIFVVAVIVVNNLVTKMIALIATRFIVVANCINLLNKQGVQFEL